MYTKEEIECWFKKLEGESPVDANKFKRLHDAGRAFALELQAILPARHESIAALDAVQTAVHWGNVAIARGESPSGVNVTVDEMNEAART